MFSIKNGNSIRMLLSIILVLHAFYLHLNLSTSSREPTISDDIGLSIMTNVRNFMEWLYLNHRYTVYPKKYAHGFVVLCFVVVMQSFIMNSHEVFIHIHQGCFAGTGTIVRLPQCQWSKPDGYGKISQCITTTKHSKAKIVCIFLGIYCIYWLTDKLPFSSAILFN